MNITYSKTIKTPFIFLAKPLFYLLVLSLFSLSINAQDFDLNSLSSKCIIFEESPAAEFSDLAYHPQENLLFLPLDGITNYAGGTWAQDWHSIRTLDLDDQSVGFATINGTLQNNLKDFEGLVYLYNNLFALTEEKSNRIYIIQLSANTTQVGNLTKYTFNIIQSNKIYESLSPVVEVPVNGGDGIEGITYNPVEDDLFVIHETTRKLYRVDLQSLLNTLDNDPVVVSQSYNLAGDMSDASGLFFNGIQDASSDQLLVLSHEDNVVLEYDVQYSANGNAAITQINNQLSIGEYQTEGIVGIGNELYLTTEGEPDYASSHYNYDARIVKFANPNSCNVDCAIGDIEVWNNSTCSCEVDIVTVSGCTDATACNFDATANCDDGSCLPTPTCNTDPCMGDVEIVDPNNACQCIVDVVQVEGCTDASACNFDATANCDDGSCIFPVSFDLTIYLEGPYNANAGEHTTGLSTVRKLLPGQTPTSNLATPTPAGQPYTGSPWNYTGTEGAGFTDADYSGDEVDWVLVTLRESASISTVRFQAAGILQKDGSIDMIQESFCLPDPTIGEYYIVIEHRNHLPVMSPEAIEINSNELLYDFTGQDSFKDSTSFGQKELPTGEWVAYAGNAEQRATDYSEIDDIKGTDKTIWFDLNGTFDQYLSGDMNLDGDVNGQDKSLWFENNGISSRVFHTN